MSNSRRTLRPYKMFDSQTLSATTIISTSTETNLLDEATICIDTTGTPVGTFTVQYQSGDSTWNTVGTLSSAVTAAGNTTFQLNAIPGERIRVIWVGTSGTGICTAIISGKGR